MYSEENNTLVSAQDLFGRYRIITNKGKAESERASLIRFFSESVSKSPNIIGIRTAHYNLDLLYSLKSQYLDRKKKSDVSANKWFWWVTRTIDNHPQEQDV